MNNKQIKVYNDWGREWQRQQDEHEKIILPAWGKRTGVIHDCRDYEVPAAKLPALLARLKALQ